jgi:Rod binding domain-containing protein
MKIPSNQNQVVVQKLPGAKSAGSQSLDAQKSRLKKATKDFEAYFMLYMLKSMRETIPKSGLLEEGLGNDIYSSMFDEELSKKLAGSSPGSLSELLYKSLEKTLVAENQPAGDAATIKKIDLQSKSLPLKSAANKAIHIPNTAAVRTPAPATTPTTKPEKEYAPTSQRPGLKIGSDPILEKYGDSIVQASKQYNVSPRLIYSVIAAESGGRHDAISSRGAKGLMQLADSTAAQMGVSDSLDPHKNIVGGTKYLRELLDRYDGDLRLTLAAYNAGPGAVSKFNGVPPYSETQEYIDKVLDRLNSGSQ